MIDEAMIYHKKKVTARQVDVLIGLSKGLSADGVINQLEAEFLQTWLVQSHSVLNNPIIANLLTKVDAMLIDGVLDGEEAQELLALLGKFNGDESVLGELAHTMSSPLNDPAPAVIFSNKKFALTGQFIFGTRTQCKAQIESLGGIYHPAVTQKLDYLILGKYVTDSWRHETFGAKIEKAVSIRDDKCKPLIIISEQYWQQQISQIKSA